MNANDVSFLEEAITLAYENVAKGGRPFGAVVVKDGKTIATGVNEILTTNDPTAHAELSALRKASQALSSPSLKGCTVYASGHPCPMCMAAMYMTGVEKVVYAYSNTDAEPFGLSTSAIYDELRKPFAQIAMTIVHAPVRIKGIENLYQKWQQKQ